MSQKKGQTKETKKLTIHKIKKMALAGEPYDSIVEWCQENTSYTDDTIRRYIKQAINQIDDYIFEADLNKVKKMRINQLLEMFVEERTKNKNRTALDILKEVMKLEGSADAEQNIDMNFSIKLGPEPEDE